MTETTTIPTKTKKGAKSVTLSFSNNEAQVLSVVLTEYVRNMTRLVMGGRVKVTPELEKELVILTNAVEKLALTDFKLRADEKVANELGFTTSP